MSSPSFRFARSLATFLVVLLLTSFGASEAEAKARRSAKASAEDDEEAKKRQAYERVRRAQEKLRGAEAELERALAEGGSLVAPERVSDLEKKMEEMQERIDLLESDLDAVIGVQDRALTALRKDSLNWFGDYRVTLNNFHLDRGIPAGLAPSAPRPAPSSNWYAGLWTHRLRLGMAWEVAKNVRFYGRLVFMKNFGELVEKDLFFDSQSSRFARDTVLRLERAYLDWFITDWLVFTAGRVAAPEGPPAELKENTQRSATWGVQMVEAEFEMVMMTLRFERWLKDSFLRMFYIPFSSVTDIDPFDENSLFVDIGIAPMHAFGSMLELKAPYLGDNLFQFGAIVVPAFRPRYLPLDDIFPSAPYPETLGWFAQLSTLFEWKDVFGSGIDGFIAYTYTFLQPSPDRLVYDLGDGLQAPLGLASYDDPDQNQAHFVYAGFRYTTPFFGAHSPKLGAELNYGSKYHFLFGSPSDLKVNKLSTRGLAAEAYWIQPLVPGRLFARVGVLHLQRQYQGSFVGPATPVDDAVTNFNAVVHASW